MFDDDFENNETAASPLECTCSCHNSCEARPPSPYSAGPAKSTQFTSELGLFSTSPFSASPASSQRSLSDIWACGSPSGTEKRSSPFATAASSPTLFQAMPSASPSLSMDAAPPSSPASAEWKRSLLAQSKRAAKSNWTQGIRQRFTYCVFCKNNQEDEEVYSTHTLKDDFGLITCPVLSMYTCPMCGATGKLAHTIRYCPSSKFLQQQMAALETSLSSLSVLQPPRSRSSPQMRAVTATRQGHYAPAHYGFDVMTTKVFM